MNTFVKILLAGGALVAVGTQISHMPDTTPAAPAPVAISDEQIAAKIAAIAAEAEATRQAPVSAWTHGVELLHKQAAAGDPVAKAVKDKNFAACVDMYARISGQHSSMDMGHKCQGGGPISNDRFLNVKFCSINASIGGPGRPTLDQIADCNAHYAVTHDEFAPE